MTDQVRPSTPGRCGACNFFDRLAGQESASSGICAQPQHVSLRLRVTPASGCVDFTPAGSAVSINTTPTSATAGLPPVADSAASMFSQPPDNLLAESAHAKPSAAPAHDTAFVLQRVQPALLGLMDGSVSTLAPIFAAAGLTGQPIKAFWIGTAASLGAGISMGLAEALSDDGTVTGRGLPLGRGVITGLATVLGGMLHTLPFLIPHLQAALYTAYAVVILELLAIAYIRFHYMQTPLVRTVAQVIVGGGIVFAVGVALGHLGALD